MRPAPQQATGFPPSRANERGDGNVDAATHGLYMAAHDRRFDHHCRYAPSPHYHRGTNSRVKQKFVPPAPRHAFPT
jgi:hypothetical protein